MSLPARYTIFNFIASLQWIKCGIFGCKDSHWLIVISRALMFSVKSITMFPPHLRGGGSKSHHPNHPHPQPPRAYGISMVRHDVWIMSRHRDLPRWLNLYASHFYIRMYMHMVTYMHTYICPHPTHPSLPCMSL